MGGKGRGGVGVGVGLELVSRVPLKHLQAVAANVLLTRY